MKISTRIASVVAAAALLGGLGVSSAGASVPIQQNPRPVTGLTYSPEHYDTTSVETGLNSPNGPIWAYDYVHEQFIATPGTVSGTWNVTIDVSGTFDGFASPTVANKPEVNKGHITGTIHYIVTSPNKPKGSYLPHTEPNYTGLGTALSQFFGGSETVTGGGAYSFSYQYVDGVVYTQTG